MRSNRLHKIAFFVLVLLECLALSLLVSCVAKNMIGSHRVARQELQPATYTVIRYRNLAVDYLTTVAFLDREDDSYTLVPRAPDFSYTVNKGLQAEDALRLAENFVRSQPSYNRTEIKAIMGPAENLLGYEVRPLYQPFVYGDDDVLDISYFLRPENKIEVWIRLKARIYQYLFHEDRR